MAFEFRDLERVKTRNMSDEVLLRLKKIDLANDNWIYFTFRNSFVWNWPFLLLLST